MADSTPASESFSPGTVGTTTGGSFPIPTNPYEAALARTPSDTKTPVTRTPGTFLPSDTATPLRVALPNKLSDFRSSVIGKPKVGGELIDPKDVALRDTKNKLAKERLLGEKQRLSRKYAVRYAGLHKSASIINRNILSGDLAGKLTGIESALEFLGEDKRPDEYGKENLKNIEEKLAEYEKLIQESYKDAEQKKLTQEQQTRLTTLTATFEKQTERLKNLFGDTFAGSEAEKRINVIKELIEVTKENINVTDVDTVEQAITEQEEYIDATIQALSEQHKKEEQEKKAKTVPPPVPAKASNFKWTSSSIDGKNAEKKLLIQNDDGTWRPATDDERNIHYSQVDKANAEEKANKVLRRNARKEQILPHEIEIPGILTRDANRAWRIKDGNTFRPLKMSENDAWEDGASALGGIEKFYTSSYIVTQFRDLYTAKDTFLGALKTAINQLGNLIGALSAPEVVDAYTKFSNELTTSILRKEETAEHLLRRIQDQQDNPRILTDNAKDFLSVPYPYDEFSFKRVGAEPLKILGVITLKKRLVDGVTFLPGDLVPFTEETLKQFTTARDVVFEVVRRLNEIDRTAITVKNEIIRLVDTYEFRQAAELATKLRDAIKGLVTGIAIPKSIAPHLFTTSTSPTAPVSAPAVTGVPTPTAPVPSTSAAPQPPTGVPRPPDARPLLLMNGWPAGIEKKTKETREKDPKDDKKTRVTKKEVWVHLDENGKENVLPFSEWEALKTDFDDAFAEYKAFFKLGDGGAEERQKKVETCRNVIDHKNDLIAMIANRKVGDAHFAIDELRTLLVTAHKQWEDHKNKARLVEIAAGIPTESKLLKEIDELEDASNDTEEVKTYKRLGRVFLGATLRFTKLYDKYSREEEKGVFGSNKILKDFFATEKGRFDALFTSLQKQNRNKTLDEQQVTEFNALVVAAEKRLTEALKFYGSGLSVNTLQEGGASSPTTVKRKKIVQGPLGEETVWETVSLEDYKHEREEKLYEHEFRRIDQDPIGYIRFYRAKTWTQDDPYKDIVHRALLDFKKSCENKLKELQKEKRDVGEEKSIGGSAEWIARLDNDLHGIDRSIAFFESVLRAYSEPATTTTLRTQATTNGKYRLVYSGALEPKEKPGILESLGFVTSKVKKGQEESEKKLREAYGPNPKPTPKPGEAQPAPLPVETVNLGKLRSVGMVRGGRLPQAGAESVPVPKVEGVLGNEGTAPSSQGPLPPHNPQPPYSLESDNGERIEPTLNGTQAPESQQGGMEDTDPYATLRQEERGKERAEAIQRVMARLEAFGKKNWMNIAYALIVVAGITAGKARAEGKGDTRELTAQYSQGTIGEISRLETMPQRAKAIIPTLEQLDLISFMEKHVPGYITDKNNPSTISLFNTMNIETLLKQEGVVYGLSTEAREQFSEVAVGLGDILIANGNGEKFYSFTLSELFAEAKKIIAAIKANEKNT